MEFSFKDLLKDAVSRAKIHRQVEAAYVVEIANQELSKLLGEQGAKQAQAMVFKNSILHVGCKSSAAAHYVGARKHDMMDALKGRLPACTIRDVRTRIVENFGPVLDPS